MINFLIHTSINARGFLMDYIKRNLTTLEKDLGETVVLNTPGHDHSKSWLQESVNKNSLPDVVLSHASDFSVMGSDKWKDLFSETAGEYEESNPIRAELRIFKDPDRLFYPIFIVPMVMFYNKKLVNEKELGNSWADILNERWDVLFPDKNTPISKAVLAFLKKNYKDEYNSLKERITFGNSPVEVIQAVAAGRYHMGISNVSFSTMAKQKGIEINWPAEGAIPLPQVLVWKKNSNPELKKIASLLTGDEIQQYLGEQGFWPVHEKTQMKIIAPPGGDPWKNTWNGWEDFIIGIRELKTRRKGSVKC